MKNTPEAEAPNKFHCPKCSGDLKRKTGTRGPFWTCSNYPDCKFTADDIDGSPMLIPCPECGTTLRYGCNSFGPYTFCAIKELHSSKESLFFDVNGKEQQPLPPLPEPKGSFLCPECKQELVYFRVKSGPNKGKMRFGCFNKEKHSDAETHYFTDRDGAPVL